MACKKDQSDGSDDQGRPGAWKMEVELRGDLSQKDTDGQNSRPKCELEQDESRDMCEDLVCARRGAHGRFRKKT